MSKSIRILALILLCAMLGSVVAAADYDYPGTVRPGDTVGFEKGEFYDARGNILTGVELSTKNFEINKRTIKTGANLVEEIKINSRSEEVQIVFTDSKLTAAPKRPNVVISALSVRARRTLKNDNGDVEVRSGTVYQLDAPINFRVGLDTESWEVNSDGTQIYLMDGEKKYISWEKGDSGLVNVSYGDMAYTEGRIYGGEKILYYYSSEVDDRLEDANPSAYITSVDMGSSEYPASTKIQLLANKEDYVYEYNNGKLSSATGLKWSEEDYAWVGKVKNAKHYVFSDTKLRSISGALVGGTTSSDDDDDDYEYDKNDPGYYNPETGNGSNIAVAISAMVAIMAVAVVSILVSGIVSVKKK